MSKNNKKDQTRLHALEYINKHQDKPKKYEDGSSIGPELALSLFGKIYGGDPSTGVVPGARPMDSEEKMEIAYKMIKDMLIKNGHNPELADKLFLKYYGKTFK